MMLRELRMQQLSCIIPQSFRLSDSEKHSVGITFVFYSFGGEYCGLVSQLSKNIVCQSEECHEKKDICGCYSNMWHLLILRDQLYVHIG